MARSAQQLDLAEWRRAAEREQQEVLPDGTVLVSCGAPLGRGGLGRHLQEIVDALERRGSTPLCMCLSHAPEPRSRRRPLELSPRLLKPLGRVSPAWRMWRVSVEFDVDAARRLPPAAHFIGFNGTSLVQLRRARAAGAPSRSLVSATVHLRSLVERHRAALRRYPLERPWSTLVLRRNLREYELAERILVSSEHVRESFLEHGIPDRVLVRFPLTPDPRFTPAAEDLHGETFEVVFVGGFTVDKGVPLLIDAVRALPHRDLRLRLVGGWKTRGMRRFVGEALAADPRIRVTVGDPLEHLRSARLYVHPAYSDGFGYAPAEALACGVPVLVSEDTGMKELLTRSGAGRVLPTGDLGALTEAIDAAYRGER